VSKIEILHSDTVAISVIALQEFVLKRIATIRGGLSVRSVAPKLKQQFGSDGGIRER